MQRQAAGVESMERSNYLYIALLATLISVVYWAAFSVNAYNTFHEYTDVAGFANGLYLDLHYSNIVGGIQYLVFDNHIAPDMLFFLPFYYIAPSPLTLLFLQDLILSLTGLMLFFIVRSLLKSESLALALCLAFLGSAGVYGMLVFDFHMEAMMIPLYLLIFYFFMKQNKLGFALASAGLLGLMEFAPFLGLSLGIGLAYYSFRYTYEKAPRRRRLIWSGSLMLASIMAFGLYSAAVNAAMYDYSHGMYQQTPLIFRATPQVSSAVSSLAGGNGFSQIAQFFGILPFVVLYGVVVAFLNFGLAIFFEPVLTAILALPWFGEAVLLGNVNFFTVFNQYYAYIFGGILVSVILGVMLANERRGFVPRRLERLFGEKYNHYVRKITLYSIILFGVAIFLLFPTFVYSKNVNSFSQDFLFQVNQSQQALYTQLNSMISRVPANAPLMAQYFIMPHVINRMYLEAIDNVTHYFQPAYIVMDFNLNISLNAFSAGQPQFIDNYINLEERNFTISVVNLSTGRIADRILGFVDPTDIAVSGNTLYAIQNATVLAADMSSDKLVGRAPLGAGYYPGIAVHDGIAYVTSQNSGSLLAVNISSGKSTVVAAGLQAPGGIYVSGNDAYVTDLADNALSVIDMPTGRVANTVPGFHVPLGVAVNGSTAYVANYNSTVSIVNLDSYNITGSIAVNGGASGIGISGNTAYVANPYADSLSVISLADNSVTGSIAGFDLPGEISVSGNRAFVTNYGYNYTYMANGTAYLFTRT